VRLFCQDYGLGQFSRIPLGGRDDGQKTPPQGDIRDGTKQAVGDFESLILVAQVIINLSLDDCVRVIEKRQFADLIRSLDEVAATVRCVYLVMH
jgi:hypothetical protein